MSVESSQGGSSRVERGANGGSLARKAGSSGHLPCRAPCVARPSTTRRDAWLEAEATGFDRLLVEQRAAWARRWADADIRIEGDDLLQQRVRLALFHLMASVGDTDEAAVGARGVTGPAYRGHVFWDSDVFVLPFLAATHPASARAMLEYRVRRLPAAREAAAALGAWGTVPVGVGPNRLRCHPSVVRGPHWHMSGSAPATSRSTCRGHRMGGSDVLAWTGDHDFATDPGGDPAGDGALLGVADRAGRCRARPYPGRDRTRRVPRAVDDNAFTNVMARWNLRMAARVSRPFGRTRGWMATSRRGLVDGYDPRTRLFEQFDGFWELEPLVIRDHRRPAPGRR